MLRGSVKRPRASAQPGAGAVTKWGTAARPRMGAVGGVEGDPGGLDEFAGPARAHAQKVGVERDRDVGRQADADALVDDLADRRVACPAPTPGRGSRSGSAGRCAPRRRVRPAAAPPRADRCRATACGRTRWRRSRGAEPGRAGLASGCDVARVPRADDGAPAVPGQWRVGVPKRRGCSRKSAAEWAGSGCFPIRPRARRVSLSGWSPSSAPPASWAGCRWDRRGPSRRG